MASTSSLSLTSTTVYALESKADVHLEPILRATKVRFVLVENSTGKEYLRGDLNVSGGLTPYGLEKLLLTEKKKLIGLPIVGIEYFCMALCHVTHQPADSCPHEWKNLPFSKHCSEPSNLKIRLTAGSGGTPGPFPIPYWEAYAEDPIISLDATPTPSWKWLPVGCLFDSVGGSCHRLLFANLHATVAQFRRALAAELTQVSYGSFRTERFQIDSIIQDGATTALSDGDLIRHHLGRMLTVKIAPKVTVAPVAAVPAVAIPESPVAMLEQLMRMRHTVFDLEVRTDRLQAELTEARSKKAELKARLIAQIEEIAK